MFNLIKFKFLNWWDKECKKIEELWTFKYPKPKKIKKVKSPDNRMNFPLEENTCPTCHKDFGCVCDD